MSNKEQRLGNVYKVSHSVSQLLRDDKSPPCASLAGFVKITLFVMSQTALEP